MLLIPIDKSFIKSSVAFRLIRWAMVCNVTSGRRVQYSTPVLGPAIDRAVRAGSVPAGTGDGIDGADVATTTGEGEDEGVEAGSCTGKTDGAAVAAAAVSSVARSTTVDAA